MKDALARYLNEEILEGGDPVGEDDDLLMSGLVDSIAIMQVVAFVEEESGLRIPPEDVAIETFRSIRTISEYVARRKAGTDAEG